MSESDKLRWRGNYPTPIGSLTSGQLKVSSVGTLILARKVNRDYAYIKCLGSPSIYIRPNTSVGTTTGEILGNKDFNIYEGYHGEIRGITAGGTVSVYYEEA